MDLAGSRSLDSPQYQLLADASARLRFRKGLFKESIRVQIKQFSIKIRHFR